MKPLLRLATFSLSVCSAASAATAHRLEVRNPHPRLIQAAAVATPALNKPRHPNAAHGPKHTVTGTIREVTCSYPSVIEFKLIEDKHTLSLYNNNFATIDLTVLGFTPSGSMNPCKDFEGRKARVQYAGTSDTTVDGQVQAVELHK